MKKVIRINESVLSGLVENVINEYMGLDPRHIKNELGIEDDDMLDDAATDMDEEDLEFEIGRAIKSLVKGGGRPSETPIDYKTLENMLLERFGFRYVGPNVKSQSLDFKNDRYVLKLFPHYSYIAPNTKPSGDIIIYNFRVSSLSRENV